MVIWLPVARLKVLNTRSLCSVKAAGAIININSDLNSAARDETGEATGNIAKVDKMLG